MCIYKIANKVIQKFFNYAFKIKWNIGFITNSLDDILSDKPITIKIMSHKCNTSWFADPFIYDVTENYIILLVEEYYYPINRGRIARLFVDIKSFELIKKETVLEINSHLSFPSIFRFGNKTFIYPENSKMSRLCIYEYDFMTNNCKKIKDISNEPLTDAIITTALPDCQLFTTRLPNPNDNELLLYKYEKETFIFQKKIVFSSKIARNGGLWFSYKGNLYRPAQDCNEKYGGAIIIQRVLYKNNDIEFHPIRRIESNIPNYILGCHTFNSYKSVNVIDIQGYRNPKLAKTLIFLINVKRKIF